MCWTAGGSCWNKPPRGGNKRVWRQWKPLEQLWVNMSYMNVSWPLIQINPGITLISNFIILYCILMYWSKCSVNLILRLCEAAMMSLPPSVFKRSWEFRKRLALLPVAARHTRHRSASLVSPSPTQRCRFFTVSSWKRKLKVCERFGFYSEEVWPLLSSEEWRLETCWNTTLFWNYVASVA